MPPAEPFLPADVTRLIFESALRACNPEEEGFATQAAILSRVDTGTKTIVDGYKNTPGGRAGWWKMMHGIDDRAAEWSAAVIQQWLEYAHRLDAEPDLAPLLALLDDAFHIQIPMSRLVQASFEDLATMIVHLPKVERVTIDLGVAGREFESGQMEAWKNSRTAQAAMLPLPADLMPATLDQVLVLLDASAFKDESNRFSLDLRFHGAYLVDAECRSIIDFLNCNPGFTGIDLRQNLFCQSTVNFLLSALISMQMESVNLSYSSSLAENPPVGGAMLQFLIEQSARLRHCDLSGNYLGHGLSEDFSFEGMRIDELILDDNWLQDCHIDRLATCFSGNTQIEVLSLRKNRFSQAGKAALATSLDVSARKGKLLLIFD